MPKWPVAAKAVRYTCRAFPKAFGTPQPGASNAFNSVDRLRI
jgi:hypothetical protein